MNGLTPDYSIVVPAYNEERFLPRTLEALHSAMAAVALSGEIVVVDNNSTDRTADIARRRGATVVLEAVNQISRARNTGARIARGRYLIFVDADSTLSPDLLQSALNRLDGGAWAGGGAIVAPDRPLEPLYRLALAAWNRFSVRFKIAAGCFIFCSRAGFEAAGGFSRKVFVGEEVWFSIALGRWARTQRLTFSIIDGFAVVTSTRKLSWYSGVQTLGLLASMVFFPLTSRHRALCRYWYQRPRPPGGGRCDPHGSRRS